MTLRPIIEIKGLKTQFGAQVIHKNLNLTVYEGEVLGIVGGSGSGKSVLMRFMVGLDPLQSGALTYYTSPPYPSTQVGVLFQSGALISSLTVIENIMVPMTEVAHLSYSLAYEIACAKIERVGLEAATADKYPSQLSGGMIKRVSLARALALDPAILFLDEPTSGLDPIAAEGFDNLIKELQQELKITVVMITHDLDSLVVACDRVAVLVDQQVITGTLKEVANTDHPWVRDYFHGARGQHLFKLRRS
ncbi:MAG: ABC transporter ATP-binding protein [Candidatus Paracaedibacter sp.]